MSYDALMQTMDACQEEILSAIQESMRIESVRGEAAEGAPYGSGPKAAMEHLLALGKKLGFQTGQAGDRVGWIEYGEGEEMAGILGHLDVVPAGEGWTYPPFGAEIHDGVLWGRGCLDDKGPIVGAVYALKAIRDLGLPMDRRIRILFGTDEECGSSCVDYYVENGYELPTLGFTPDAQFPAIFCEKGTSNFTCSADVDEQGEIDVVSLEGGIAANVVIPACRLTVRGDLKVKESKDITVTREGDLTIVEAAGVSAHGSTPYLGVNAAVSLFEAVSENSFGGSFQKLLNFVLECIGRECHGESLGIHYVDEETGETSLNLGLIQYDGKKMGFTLDIRYPKNAKANDVDASVEQHIKAYGFETESLSHAELLYVPKDSELLTKLVKVYSQITGDMREPIAIGGGTYAKRFPNMVAFGPVFPGEPDVIHQPDEHVEIKKLMDALKIIAAAMYELSLKS